MRLLRGFLSALGFLTVCPVPASIHTDDRARRWSAACFPLVGIALGLASLALWAALRGAEPLVRAVALALLPVLLTRALHLDGLADTLDGLGRFGSATAKRAAMRDPRLGAFGVLALVFDILARVVAVAALARPAALVIAPVLGRWSLAAALRRVPYDPTGKLRAAVPPPSRGGLAAATLVAVAVCLTHPRGLLALVVAALLIWRWPVFIRRRLGALSGDSLGALNELVEVGALLVLTY